LLYPADYRRSLEWRRQAEHQMIAAGSSGMTDAEVEQFGNILAIAPPRFIYQTPNNSSQLG